MRKIAKQDCLVTRQPTIGFTLIELLVVISIIGILTAFALANFIQLRQSARDAQRKSDLKTLQSAMEFFYNSPPSGQGASYPAAGTWKNDLTNSTQPAIQSSNWPVDPSDKTNYFYTPAPGSCAPGTNSCRSYILWACVENDKDPQADKNRTGGTIQSCANGRYSYSVTSP